MAERPDRQARKETLDIWRARQRKAARDVLPLPEEQMRAMFDMLLDASLRSEACDHSLKLVRNWAMTFDLPFGAIQGWCLNNGGYCDCEVLANCEQAFEEAIRDVDWER